VIMLVKLGDDERRRNRLSSLTFVVITIVPWVVMIWLLWPRR
jgi:predicted nucleic acid-binding Zn ribbon protein